VLSVRPGSQKAIQLSASPRIQAHSQARVDMRLDTARVREEFPNIESKLPLFEHRIYNVDGFTSPEK